MDQYTGSYEELLGVLSRNSRNLDIGDYTEVKKYLLATRYTKEQILKLKEKLDSNRKEQNRHSDDVRHILLDWFQSHEDHPYPTDDEKEELELLTGLTRQQLVDWFVNQRKRHWNRAPPTRDISTVPENRAAQSTSAISTVPENRAAQPTTFHISTVPENRAAQPTCHIYTVRENRAQSSWDISTLQENRAQSSCDTGGENGAAQSTCGISTVRGNRAQSRCGTSSTVRENRARSTCISSTVRKNSTTTAGPVERVHVPSTIRNDNSIAGSSEATATAYESFISYFETLPLESPFATDNHTQGFDRRPLSNCGQSPNSDEPMLDVEVTWDNFLWCFLDDVPMVA